MTDLDKQFEELMLRMKKAEDRVIELESDNYVNSVKASAFEEGFRYSCGVYKVAVDNYKAGL
jgi:hypothetical protein